MSKQIIVIIIATWTVWKAGGERERDYVGDFFPAVNERVCENKWIYMLESMTEEIDNELEKAKPLITILNYVPQIVCLQIGSCTQWSELFNTEPIAS